MIEGLLAGTLSGDPEKRVGKAGSEFVVARMRAHSADNEPVVINVIAFAADVSARLLGMREGDAVSLAGSLSPRVWQDRQGNHRPALDLVAQRLLAVSE